MDLNPGRGDNPVGIGSQAGEKVAGRDSGDQETRTAEYGSDRHQIAKTEGGDESVGVQRNHEGVSAKANSGKRKKRKTIRWAAESPASRLRQDLRFQGDLEQLDRNVRPVPRTQVPPRKPYQPYLFNSLRPYYSISSIGYLTGPPPEVKGHRSRRTAYGLIEPWVDLQMGNDLQSETTDHVSHGRKINTKRAVSSRPSCIPKEDNGRLPKFAGITPETHTLPDKQQQDYSDVSILRLDLRANSSHRSRRKFLTDYQQTHDHFYRSQLHRLDQMSPASRKHVCTSYLAYLHNSPGSRRAINDCLRRLTLFSSG